MGSKTFKVPNMTCNGCVNTVRAELEGIPGVEVVDIQKAPQLVTVQLDNAETWTTIEQALTEINYAPAEA
jgi:copper chaperone CopZ